MNPQCKLPPVIPPSMFINPCAGKLMEIKEPSVIAASKHGHTLQQGNYLCHRHYNQFVINPVPKRVVHKRTYGKTSKFRIDFNENQTAAAQPMTASDQPFSGITDEPKEPIEQPFDETSVYDQFYFDSTSVEPYPMFENLASNFEPTIADTGNQSFYQGKIDDQFQFTGTSIGYGKDYNSAAEDAINLQRKPRNTIFSTEKVFSTPIRQPATETSDNWQLSDSESYTPTRQKCKEWISKTKYLKRRWANKSNNLPSALPATPKTMAAVIKELQHLREERDRLRRQIRILKGKKSTAPVIDKDPVLDEFLAENIESQLSSPQNEIGSTVLIRTSILLQLLLHKPCNNCSDSSINNCSWKPDVSGYGLKVKITCNICGNKRIFCNGTNIHQFNMAAPAASLISGCTRTQLNTVMHSFGVTAQLSKKQFFDNQSKILAPISSERNRVCDAALDAACKQAKVQGKSTLAVTFDASYSQCRNAKHASSEFILHDKVDGYERRPIVGALTVDKKAVREFTDDKGNKKTVVTNIGNVEGPSKSFEHTMLKNHLTRLGDYCNKYQLQLEVTVDGDLDINATLASDPIVKAIYRDSTHKGRNIVKMVQEKFQRWRKFAETIRNNFIRYLHECVKKKYDPEVPENLKPTEKEFRNLTRNVFVKHLLDNHSECWEEVCFLKARPDLELKGPCLKSCSQREIDDFSAMLDVVLHLPPSQSLLSIATTNYNEAFNKKKKTWAPKDIEYPKSYDARISMAFLDYMLGYMKAVTFVVSIYDKSFFTVTDLKWLEKEDEERQSNRAYNLKHAEEAQLKKAEKMKRLRQELEDVDLGKEFVFYKDLNNPQWEMNRYVPVYAEGVIDRSDLVCNGCKVALRIPMTERCKICQVYATNGLWNLFPNKGFKPDLECVPSGKGELFDSALQTIFGLNSFRDIQREAIESFYDNNDIFVVMKTGGGKSLCFLLPALISPGVTIVFCPLNALVENHEKEARKLNLPVASLHGPVPAETRKRILSDIALDLIKIIFTTPEQYSRNPTFIKLLQNIARRGDNHLRFVIDEAHCIETHRHFRDSYTKLASLKTEFPSAPILLCSATCTEKSISWILSQMNIVNAKKIISSNLNRPELIYSVIKKPTTKDEQEKLLLGIINLYPNEKGIIYYGTREMCSEMASRLKFHNIKAEYYIGLSDGGEISSHERSERLAQFSRGEIKVMVATEAFGMGINEDIGYVIHASIPQSMLSYIQQAGRAGRNGSPSYSILLYNRKDVLTMDKVITLKNDIPIAPEQAELARKALKEVILFCEDKKECQDGDNICDNCKSRGQRPAQQIDVTYNAVYITTVCRKSMETGEIRNRNQFIKLINTLDVQLEFMRIIEHLPTYLEQRLNENDTHRLIHLLVYLDILKEQYPTPGSLPNILIGINGNSFLSGEGHHPIQMTLT